MTPAPVNITVLPSKTFIEVQQLDADGKPVGRPVRLWGGQTQQVQIQEGKSFLVRFAKEQK